MKNKLSSTQKEIIKLMKDGWHLGKSDGLRTSSWLQENGVGRGGKTKYFSVSTFIALYHKGLIECTKTGFPTSIYSLTDKAKSIEL